MKTTSANLGMQGRHIAFIAAVTAAVLAVPLVAMRFSDEVAWTLSDFIVAGALLFGAGLTYEFLASRTRSTGRRAVIGVTVAVALAVIWIQLAVGIFD